MENNIFESLVNGDKINSNNFNLDIYNESKRNCLTCYKADVKSIIANGAKIFCYSDKKCFKYLFININTNNDCENYQSYKSLLTESKNKSFNIVYKQIFGGPNFIEDSQLLKMVKSETGETIAHIQAQHGWITNDKEMLVLKDNTGWTVAHEVSMRGNRITDKEILKLTDNQGTTVLEIQVLHNWFVDDSDLVTLPARSNTKTIAHVQAMLGWITYDEDILKLRDSNGTTVKHIITSMCLIKSILIKDEEKKKCSIIKTKKKNLKTKIE